MNIYGLTTIKKSHIIPVTCVVISIWNNVALVPHMTYMVPIILVVYQLWLCMWLEYDSYIPSSIMHPNKAINTENVVKKNIIFKIEICIMWAVPEMLNCVCRHNDTHSDPYPFFPVWYNLKYYDWNCPDYQGVLIFQVSLYT